MKIARDWTHARGAIQLSAIYTEMLMVVRELDTLGRSFDGEDSRSRVAVSDVIVGAILGKHKSTPDKSSALHRWNHEETSML